MSNYDNWLSTEPEAEVFYRAELWNNQDQLEDVEYDLLPDVVEKAAKEMLGRYPDYTVLVFTQNPVYKHGRQADKPVFTVRN